MVTVSNFQILTSFSSSIPPFFTHFNPKYTIKKILQAAQNHERESHRNRFGNNQLFRRRHGRWEIDDSDKRGGQRTTLSVVAYMKVGDRLVGQIAKRQAVVNPENAFFGVKRFMGRKMNEVDEELKQVSYTVVRDDNGNVKLDCPAIGKQFAAE